MVNKVAEFIRRRELLSPGDEVVCAVSGGMDSVALLYALLLLRDRLSITLSAAHFNHHLRGAESDRDAEFVADLCRGWDIPLHMGQGSIVPGKKGLEAAAREARYAYLLSLPGKIATAHTADDNAETVLMHMVRGTGLKGLGGIAPCSGRLIRPMLCVTRREVEEFHRENHLHHVEDSTNASADFLRNRIRGDVMPLLKKENPQFSRKLSEMALSLRDDERALASLSAGELPDVPTLRALPRALRVRYLSRFLMECGIPEPEQSHILLAESLVFSDKPSARARFANGKVIAREYDRLILAEEPTSLPTRVLPCPGTLLLPEAGLRVSCAPAEKITCTRDTFTFCPEGEILVRARESGDTLRLSGGTASLKKRMIDRKIPAARRGLIPVVCDAGGIVGVYGFGSDILRAATALPAVTVRIEEDYSL